MKFSVLMSIYINTDSRELLSCLQSISEQTLPPSQVVVVVDGPIDHSVRTILESYQRQAELQVDIIEFSENRGLGAALADGLKSCRHELVARVDTDDVNLPKRFELQHEYFSKSPETSVLGGLLEEVYERDKEETSYLRSVPIDPNKIRKSALYRNPLNHPTVMLRKDHVLKSGNYKSLLWFEDYYLWARMIMKGYQLVNINRVLVRTSADKHYFLRRGGLKYMKQELVLTSKLREIGFHNLFQSIRFITVRLVFRVIPVNLRSWLYLQALRRENKLDPVN